MSSFNFILQVGTYRHRGDVTWVCGWNDRAEEEAVGVVKFIRELPNNLHQLHDSIHQIPKTRPQICQSHLSSCNIYIQYRTLNTSSTMLNDSRSRNVCVYNTKRKALKCVFILPNNKAGDGCSEESVQYDGAQVPKEMSLKERRIINI